VSALLQSNLKELPVRRGKVRDVYDLGDRLLLVATDRLSAFDWVLPTGIPDKGRVLTALSAWWFERLKVPNHLLSLAITDLSLDLTPEQNTELAGRVMIVRKTRVVPFECVVRGYVAGSAWKDYRASGGICGIRLPTGLSEAEAIEPIFTPATKAESGHDENVSFDTMAELIGQDLANRLREESLRIYREAAAFARLGATPGRGRSPNLILADTKLEWGIEEPSGSLLLIDEVLTPDSSRYWDTALYRVGRSPASFDKQFVRDWLERSGWDKASPPPALPVDIVARTRAKYIECYERLTGQMFPWK
jgi:phosphoribosylaminoimidazole-succinocarboxamide synthase